jgi:hypothetical protein
VVEVDQRAIGQDDERAADVVAATGGQPNARAGAGAIVRSAGREGRSRGGGGWRRRLGIQSLDGERRSGCRERPSQNRRRHEAGEAGGGGGGRRTSRSWGGAGGNGCGNASGVTCVTWVGWFKGGKATLSCASRTRSRPSHRRLSRKRGAFSNIHCGFSSLARVGARVRGWGGTTRRSARRLRRGRRSRCKFRLCERERSAQPRRRWLPPR